MPTESPPSTTRAEVLDVAQNLEYTTHDLGPEMVEAHLSSAVARLRAVADAMSEADPGLTFAEFSAANLARCESPAGFYHTLDSWSLSDWMTATMGELGEAANIAKKLNRCRDGIVGNKQSAYELRERLRSEIADALIYLDLLAQSQGFSLALAVIETFDRKSREIGYPARLSAEDPGDLSGDLPRPAVAEACVAVGAEGGAA